MLIYIYPAVCDERAVHVGVTATAVLLRPLCLPGMSLIAEGNVGPARTWQSRGICVW